MIMGSKGGKKKAPDPWCVFRGHKTDTRAVEFHPGGNLLFSGDADGEVKVWDLTSRRAVFSKRAHSGTAGILAIRSLPSFPDVFLSQSRDGLVKQWKLTESGISRDPVGVILTGSYNFCRLSVVRDWTYAVVQDENDAIGARFGSVEDDDEKCEVNASCETSIEKNKARSSQIERTENVSLPNSVDKDDKHGEEHDSSRLDGKGARVRDCDDLVLEGETSGELTAPPDERAQTREADVGSGPELQNEGSASNLGEDSMILLAGKDPSVVEVWSVAAAKPLLQLSHCSSTTVCGSGLSGMCMAVEGFRQPRTGVLTVSAGFEDGTLRVWDARQVAKPLICEKLHSEPILSLGLESSCCGGVSGAADDRITFFHLDFSKGTCSVQAVLEHGRPGIADVAIRPDDRIIAAGGWDHRVRIFDYKRRRPLAILKYHSATVSAVSFSPDGRFLASASDDATIALWSIYPPHGGQ